ncbi:MAG: fimbrillin family protein [Bacteroidaceae bacterium]|nr:fimbrillin family protein [Bacteroidaceae bacterium]
MNFKKTYLLLSAALCLLGGIAASCTQDDSVAGAGTSLPPGEHPLQLTASVGAHIQSRSECKDEWKEDDIIAVRIGNYPVTGSYMLNADGTVKKSVNALSWPQPEDYVTAWYPFVFHDEPQTKPLTDQSDGLVGYDLLGTEPVYKNYKETVDLKFLHRMTKVICKLMPGDGISAEEFATAVLSINGFTAAQFNQGIVTPGGENGWLKPFFDAGSSTPDCPVYEALLVPQDMTGKLLFKIDITVNVNGHLIPKTLTYQADAESGKLEAGYYSTYTIVVQKDRLLVNPPVTASWNDDREPSASQPWIFKVVMKGNLNIPESRRKDLAFSDNVVNAEDFKQNRVDTLYVAGNDFSISCTIVNEEQRPRMNLMDAVEGIDKMTSSFEVDPLRNSVTFNFDFHLRSDVVTLAYKEFSGHEDPEVGSFYYDDGTWSRNLNSSKKCIGIVFAVLENKEWWREDGMKKALEKLNDFGEYDLKNFKDQSVHGYVVALQDAGSETVVWMTNPNDSKNLTKDCGTGLYSGAIKGDTTKYYNGYSNLTTIKKIKEDDDNPYTFPAFDACIAYNDIAEAPGSSSGWYLPSLDQYKSGIFLEKQIIEEKISQCGGTKYLLGSSSSAARSYWTSTELATATRKNSAYFVYFQPSGACTAMGGQKANATAKRCVRAILTF